MRDLHSEESSILDRSANRRYDDFIAVKEPNGGEVLEVLVLWGATILAARHLGEDGEIVVGDAKTSVARLPEAVLGSPHVVIARASEGSFTMMVPPFAIAKMSGSDVHMTGPCEVSMTSGERARMMLGGFEIWISVLPNAPKLAPTPLFDRLREGGVGYIAAAGLAHGALFGALAYHRSDLHLEEESAEARAKRLGAIRQYLRASAEPEREVEERGEAEPAARAPGGGARAMGSEGKLGKEGAKAEGRRYAVAGREDEADPRLSRERALAEARDFGAIGLLAMASKDPNAPTAPWGDAIARGIDPKSALGIMFGATIGESGGMNGLGLSGTGEGGGGKFQGIGLDAIGSRGHFTGPPGTGPGGFGNCTREPCGRNLRPHVTRGPSLREAGKTEVSGRLAPELIQRVVRQNFGRFRSCYEAGLRANPSLEGRVVTRFVIDRSGAVTQAVDGGSDLPDKSVTACVTRAFYALSFPEVSGGIVRIVYPLMFTPG